MKVTILGYRGMLGRYMFQHFKRAGYQVEVTTRKHLDAAKPGELINLPGDVIINCIGTIKPRMKEVGIQNAIKVNSIFPHELADYCQRAGKQLFHITTDCVFSGFDGPYDELDKHDALDDYGKSKSLGEPTNCLTLRTSIIGEEVGQKRSLVEWVKTQAKSECNGFVDHLWNGVTCLQLAQVVEFMIKQKFYTNGVRHVFSPNHVNKYKLVSMINEAYNLGIEVNPTKTVQPIDRRLSTVYENSHYLEIISPLALQIYNMKDFPLE